MLVSVDKGSVGTIPRVRIVHQKDFLGLVADTEWDAIRAAEELKVSWSEPDGLVFPDMDALYDHIRKAPVMRASKGSGFRPTVKFDEGPSTNDNLCTLYRFKRFPVTNA